MKLYLFIIIIYTVALGCVELKVKNREAGLLAFINVIWILNYMITNYI